SSSLFLLVSASLAASTQVPLRSYLLALQEVTALAAAPPGHPICVGVFHSCMSSKSCDSGTVCSIADKNTPCCTSAENSCPSPQTMGITCSKTRATNWCSSNSDCGMGVCCATGCGYNVCWTEAPAVGGAAPAAVPRRLFHSFHDDSSKSECPDPNDVPVTCTAQRPVDWCLRHDECPSTPSNRRLCCLTQCGHHVCMRRTPAGVWIIA
ncbi:hypothetical protein PENTCL1PPCAC_1418, partial [Pristionchus entomophagus]